MTSAVDGNAGGRSRSLLVAVAIVLGLRVLYLARFGWDGCWMNYNFLLEAKAYALGGAGEAHGLPLTPLFVWACRRIGLGPLAALGAIYLVAQALFTVSALVLFRFFVPGASRRRELVFVVALAAIPMLSVDTGYKDLAVTLGAGLMMAALACALSVAGGDRLRLHVLAPAALLAALGAACRMESAAGTALMAGGLLLAGRRAAAQAHPIPRRHAAAAALLTGTALGLVLTMLISRELRGAAQLGSATYKFYTFYDGLPYLMRPAVLKLPSEYGRYLASVDIFGSFADNHGSLRAALLSHPGKAFLRIALKVPDLVAGASWLRGVAPLGVLFALVGIVAGARVGGVAARGRAALLLAFLGPVAVLLIPPASDFYFLSVLFPVLLAIAAGIEVLLGRSSERTVRWVAGASIAATAVLVAAVGRPEPSNSRTINEAARYLESECRAGCLANYLPAALSSQAWVDLEASAPFPEKVKRSEAFVTGQYPPGYARGCRFDERMRQARDRGYRGPVLYVDVRVTSTRVFSDLFDPERRFEEKVDLSGARLRQRFSDRDDVISIYELPVVGS